MIGNGQLSLALQKLKKDYKKGWNGSCKTSKKTEIKEN